MMRFFGKKQGLDMNRLPAHVAIIMDGNGRWAQKRGLPRSAGHAAGAVNFKRIVEYGGNLGIKHLTFYAFSTENWKRPKQEIDYLMSLFLNYLRENQSIMLEKGIYLNVIGDLSEFSDELRAEIEKTRFITEGANKLFVNIAVNYGGRAELARAVRNACELAVKGRLKPESIDEAAVSGLLYTAGQPDPDLIIRPSGELRLSNFLLYQAAYAELWFSNVLWPDFSARDFDAAIIDFQKRKRRFGGRDA